MHSFAGIWVGQHRETPSSAASARWRSVSALVIEEVSMLSNELAITLDQHARHARNSTRAFGGVQLVLIGDGFQLKPVRGAPFIDSALWRQANIIILELITTVRQSRDPLFALVLNRIRKGIFTEADSQVLQACVIHPDRHPLPTGENRPVKIFCNNEQVDVENAKELAKLPHPQLEYEADDCFSNLPDEPEEATKRRTRLMELMEEEAPTSVFRFKIGARVLLLRNWPEVGLVNGSRGVIVDRFPSDVHAWPHTEKFAKGVPAGLHPQELPLVRFEGKNGAVNVIVPAVVYRVGSSEDGAMARTMLPLTLAWALTVHKSQGMTLDGVEMDLSRAFTAGQAYVGLSRATTRGTLWLRTHIKSSMVRTCADMLNFYDKEERSTTTHECEFRCEVGPFGTPIDSPRNIAATQVDPNRSYPDPVPFQ